MVDANDVLTATLATLNATLPATVRAYDRSKVPAPRPPEYVEVGVGRISGGEQRACGATAVTGWRITARALSQVSVHNANNSLSLCDTALDAQRLAVNAQWGFVAFESGDDPAYDDGWFDGLHTYTTAI